MNKALLFLSMAAVLEGQSKVIALPGKSPIVTFRIVFRTGAAADPIHSCTGFKDDATVWFRYTATFTGLVNVNTYGSDYDTVVSVHGNTDCQVIGTQGACSDDIAFIPKRIVLPT